MKKTIFLLITSILFSQIICAQYMTAADYIAQYKDIAISEMKRMGVPAAISLAQGLLETENGNSDLVKRSNNHFGIKCKSSWTAETTSHDDDAPGECFRVYKTAEDSYRDHSNFLRGRDNYAFLFKLDPRDYKAWAYGLRKAGYATNPKYPEILIKNIEDNNLQQYTLEGADEVPVFDASKYTDDPEDKTPLDTSSIGLKTNDAEAKSNGVGYTQMTINGCKALMVPKGTSLLAVASQNNINLARLLDINDLKKDGLLEKDQIIFLDKKQKQGDKDYYIVQQNESLFDVAQKNGIMLQSLYDYNNISSADYLQPGTKILLRPAGATSYPKAGDSQIKSSYPVNNTSHEKPVFHEVQPGENLFAISKKYGVSVDQLKEWNNLTGNDLKIGQQLIISK
jgi:LysM repeat protein